MSFINIKKLESRFAVWLIYQLHLWSSKSSAKKFWGALGRSRNRCSMRICYFRMQIVHRSHCGHFTETSATPTVSQWVLLALCLCCPTESCLGSLKPHAKYMQNWAPNAGQLQPSHCFSYSAFCPKFLPTTWYEGYSSSGSQIEVFHISYYLFFLIEDYGDSAWEPLHAKQMLFSVKNDPWRDG